MGQPKITQSLTFSGRTFCPEELQLIQAISADFASLGRTEISRTVCELLEWKRPNGGLKSHECRLLLERLQALGLEATCGAPIRSARATGGTGDFSERA